MKRLLALILLVASCAHATICTASGVKQTGTGTGNISLTGVNACDGGWKLLLLFTSDTGDNSARGKNDVSMSFGIAVSSSSRRAMWLGALDGTDPSQADNIMRDDKVLMIYNGTTPTLMWDADFVSFNSDGFTINLTTKNAAADDTPLYYFLLGGTEINNVGLQTTTFPGSTGTFDITGFGFQPNFVMVFGTNATALNTNTATAEMSIGWSNGIGAGLCSGKDQDGANSANTSQYFRGAASGQGDIWALISASGDAADQRISFDSFLSNGVRLNAIERTSANATEIFILAVEGGAHQVGTYAQGTTAGANFQTTGYTPWPMAGLFECSNYRTANMTVDAPTAGLHLSIGAATSSSARAVSSIGSNDNVAANDARGHCDLSTRHACKINPTTPTTLQQETDFVSYDEPSRMTMNQVTTSDSGAYLHLYWLVGHAPSKTRRVWIP